MPQERVPTWMPVLSKKWLTQSILHERIVLRFADVTSASATGTNAGSREEHSTGAVSVAQGSRSRCASTTDHGENVEVTQLVAIPMPQIMGNS